MRTPSRLSKRASALTPEAVARRILDLPLQHHLRFRTVLLAVLGVCAFAPSRTLAQVDPPVQVLHPAGAQNDAFGNSVAIDGNTMIVGARGDTVDSNTHQGSAHIYRWNGSGWVFEATLTAADGAATDIFGCSVALSGNTAIVGSFQHRVGTNISQGSAYVFVRSGATWTQQAQLTAPDGAAGDDFGYSVALIGDTAIVGAPNDDLSVTTQDARGSAYVFTRSSATWTQQAKLTASNGTENDRFGDAVAVSNDTTIVSARSDVGTNESQGSAYVFVRSGATWTQQAQLTANDGAANDYFGWSVALSGDTAIVGAFQDDVGANFDQGSAYVFTRSGTVWTQQVKLTASEGAANDHFGVSVALGGTGETVVVGAPDDDLGANADQGSAYLFTRVGTVWTQQTRLTAPNGAQSEFFGRSVAIYSGAAVIGAEGDNIGPNTYQGSAWVYGPCPVPSISGHPQSLALLPGVTAAFSVTAPNATSFQWRRNGAALSNGGRVSGANSSTLTITGVQNADQGAYDCIASSCWITFISQPAALSCVPILLSQPPAFGLLTPGTQLAVTVPVGAAYTYRWRQNGQNLFNIPGFYSGVTTPTLTILTVDPSLEGTYDVMVTNTCGTFTSSEAQVSICDRTDFNGDGLYPDTADVDDFLSVFSGGPCSNDPICGDIDFNNDGLYPDTADIDALLSVFSGGPCV